MRLRSLRNKAGLLGVAALPVVMAAGLKPSVAVEYQVKPSAQPVITRQQATFPHGKEKHKTLDCSRCHRIEPGNIDETRFTGHLSCLACHNLAIEALVRPVTFCGICHDGRAVSKQQPALFKYPKRAVQTDFGIRFGHPSHLKLRNIGAFDRASLNNPLLNTSVLGTGDTPRCDDCHKPNDIAGATTPKPTAA